MKEKVRVQDSENTVFLPEMTARSNERALAIPRHWPGFVLGSFLHPWMEALPAWHS